MARDYISESKAIGADLAKAGFNEWQLRINEAIAAGSTGTEIAMAVRFQLNEILKTNPNTDVIDRVRDTIALLDKMHK